LEPSLLGNVCGSTSTKSKRRCLKKVCMAQCRSAALAPWTYRERPSNRARLTARAGVSGAYTMAEVGGYFGVHYLMVSRAVKRFERRSRRRNRNGSIDAGSLD
jgi:hypothetical protein